MTTRTGWVTRGLAAGLGFGLTRAAWTALHVAPPGGPERWERINHRGGAVTLLEGPAVAAGLATAVAVTPGLPRRVRAGAALAALGAGGFGVLDDLAERGQSKGLRGHLGALGRGELTTGGARLLGIGAVGMMAAAVARPGGGAPSGGGGWSGGGWSGGRAARALDLAAGGALVAGSANLLNLFDLRPGRALKVSLLAAVPGLVAAGPAGRVAAAAAGASVALLGDDLGERTMLGDGGANALGAVLGVALVAGGGRRSRWTALAAVTALTLASERVSFTRVIAATPGLRELDALGRRPATR
jgi:UDP-GlcNAc:undecaprenyl-phosphate/decaprenyl-phosphate GlcNAc-1-phosphate transferase